MIFYLHINFHQVWIKRKKFEMYLRQILSSFSQNCGKTIVNFEKWSFQVKPNILIQKVIGRNIFGQVFPLFPCEKMFAEKNSPPLRFTAKLDKVLIEERLRFFFSFLPRHEIKRNLRDLRPPLTNAACGSRVGTKSNRSDIRERPCGHNTRDARFVIIDTRYFYSRCQRRIDGINN